MYVYFIQAGENGPVKIGVANNVNGRLDQLQTGNHLKLTILKKIKYLSKSNSYHIEGQLHHKFRKYRIRGEWFKPIILNGEFESKEHKEIKKTAVIATKNQNIMDGCDRKWEKAKKQRKESASRCPDCNAPTQVRYICGANRIENIYGGKHNCAKYLKERGHLLKLTETNNN